MLFMPSYVSAKNLGRINISDGLLSSLVQVTICYILNQSIASQEQFNLQITAGEDGGQIFRFSRSPWITEDQEEEEYLYSNRLSAFGSSFVNSSQRDSEASAADVDQKDADEIVKQFFVKRSKTLAESQNTLS